ncbi:hypothetical protein [Streptosporangium sp. NPDC000396]|uniref:hypothetical protein n=1 Tax=Streptosporangium sp. NPDC000396 TaxID=3366185 RepID=UPI0036C79590
MVWRSMRHRRRRPSGSKRFGIKPKSGLVTSGLLAGGAGFSSSRVRAVEEIFLFSLAPHITPIFRRAPKAVRTMICSHVDTVRFRRAAMAAQ